LLQSLAVKRSIQTSRSRRSPRTAFNAGDRDRSGAAEVDSSACEKPAVPPASDECPPEPCATPRDRYRPALHVHWPAGLLKPRYSSRRAPSTTSKSGQQGADPTGRRAACTNCSSMGKPGAINRPCVPPGQARRGNVAGYVEVDRPRLSDSNDGWRPAGALRPAHLRSASRQPVGAPAAPRGGGAPTSGLRQHRPALDAGRSPRQYRCARSS